MQPHPAIPTGSAVADLTPSPGGSLGRGLLAGLVPVALLLVVTALTVLAAFIVQLATIPQGFAMRQTLAVGVVGAGLAVAFVVYAIVCVRTLHHVGTWQRAGGSRMAAGALWGLSIGAVIVALPLVVGALIPQYPAPLLR